jgi:hypothetical protein
MDLGVIITSVIFIILVSLPFLIINRQRKKKEKQLLQSLKDAANHHQCTLTKVELCGNYAIGMDEKKDFVFFKNKSDQKENVQFIDLGLVESCELTNTERKIKTNDGAYQVVDQLYLSFTPWAGNGSNIKWVFFHTDSHMQLNGELQSVEKWSKLIKERLKSKAQ